MEYFLRKYLPYYVYKPTLLEEKFKNYLSTVFSGPKVLIFWIKSVPWTGNELAGDDVENCENAQLTRTNLSYLM